MDRVILAVAVALALGSTTAFGLLVRRHAVPSASTSPARVPAVGGIYEPRAPRLRSAKTEIWAEPAAQSRGSEWVYDAFTPPEIFYDPRAKEFTVKPPVDPIAEEIQDPFGLELVAVRPEPFRLQLVGYVGEEGNWRGTFENVISGETFLGAGGRRVPSLALTIRSLEVELQPVRIPDSMTTYQRVATAVVHDEKAGCDVRLTQRERHFAGAGSALVAASGRTMVREVRTGDTLKIGDVSYHIDAISTSPPSVEVVKTAPASTQPERRVLTPREADPSRPRDESGGGP